LSAVWGADRALPQKRGHQRIERFIVERALAIQVMKHQIAVERHHQEVAEIRSLE